MAILGNILFFIGLIIAIVGSVWFVVVAFQESVLWGLGCLFVPLVSLIFLVMHSDRALKPFLVQLAGVVPIVIGLFLIGPQN